MRQYQGREFVVTLDNCSDRTITVDDEWACGYPRLAEVTVGGGGEQGHLSFGTASRTPQPGECGDARAYSPIAPGANVSTSVLWDGTYTDTPCGFGCDVRTKRPASVGEHVVVAVYRLDDGSEVRGTLALDVAPAAVPPAPEPGELELVLNATYGAEEHAQVILRNVGTRTYVYNPWYASCGMSYYTDDGRPFRVPEGTHCDLVGYQDLAPGDEVLLFTWSLDECVVDNWGCSQAEPLPPGTYHLRGSFAVKGTESTHDPELSAVGASFEIVASA